MAKVIEVWIHIKSKNDCKNWNILIVVEKGYITYWFKAKKHWTQWQGIATLKMMQPKNQSGTRGKKGRLMSESCHILI